MNKSPVEFNKIIDAINQLGIGWSLCFIGEDQSSKLGTLTKDLKRGFSETGDKKQIASGFSYWGIGPTIAWIMACKDRLYPVMSESIKHFAKLWAQTLPHLDFQEYHCVSLGVGTGEKDSLILQDLFHMNKNLYYFPVDMSPEMLRMGAREAIKGTQLERSKLLPIQIDFSFDENIQELRDLLDRILGNEPILFSLLGNTLSNFDGDVDLLETITRIIRPQDRLLLEVAFTDSLSEEAQKEAADEYDRSRLFKEFVSSSLLQNTDLSVDTDNVSFAGSAEKNRAILVKSLYRNKTETPLRITLPDRTIISFLPNDTIRLSTMRKYTESGIQGLTQHCGLSLQSRAKQAFQSHRKRFQFGTELMLLARTEDSEKKRREYDWDIFLAHAAADIEAAEALYALLKSQCKIFLDKHTLLLGDNWDIELSRAQSRSLVTVVLVSSNTSNAFYQREEIAAAIQMARREQDAHRIVPIFLPNANEDIPYGLRVIHGLYLSSLEELQDVAEKLLRLLGQLR